MTVRPSGRRGWSRACTGAALLGLSWLLHGAPTWSAPGFVGCPVDGQSGPVAAPAPASPSDRLAVYAAEGWHALAPPGWRCRYAYGSGGAVLLVTPGADAVATMPDFGTLTGSAVELVFLNGENSGREQVADLVARLFPAERRFAEAVARDADPPIRLSFRPFRADTLIRHGRAEIEFGTPAFANGLGTYASRLRPDRTAIRGVAMLVRSNGVDGVLLVRVRLPSASKEQSDAILTGARRSRHDRGTSPGGSAR